MSRRMKADKASVFKGCAFRCIRVATLNKENVRAALDTDGESPDIIAKHHKTSMEKIEKRRVLRNRLKKIKRKP